MGWVLTRGNRPSDYVDELLRYYSSEDSRLSVLDIKRTYYGTRAWILFETKETKEKFICLYLFEKGKGGWWYKDMDETMHPYFYDCPVSLIDRASPTNNKSANEWRQNVRNYWQKRREKNADSIQATSNKHIGALRF